MIIYRAEAEKVGDVEGWDAPGLSFCFSVVRFRDRQILGVPSKESLAVGPDFLCKDGDGA